VLGVLVLTLAFQWIYAAWLNPVWGYLGFAYNTPPLGYFILACLVCILPSLWIPLALTRPSQLIYWLLYVTVYIPSILVALNAALMPLSQVLWLMVTLLAGFGVMGLSYFRPLLNIRRPYESKEIFWYGLAAITIGLIGWVWFIYSGHFQIVSFASVYEQLRFSGGALGSGTGVGYALMWLSGAVFPFFITLALFKRWWLVFLGGALGELMLYASGGMKGPVLTLVFIPLMYFYLKSNKAPNFGPRLVWTLGPLLVALTVINVALGERTRNTAVEMGSSIVAVRVFAISGLSTAYYQRFFASRPLTYYSHVTGMNLLVEYPYDRSIGEEVGFDMYNSNEVNWNANFWATDGLAALGLPGIIVISLVAGFLFWILDSVAQRHDPVFAAVVCCYAAANIGNTSLFTSFVSGGLGFLVVLFFFMPKGIEKRKQKPVPEPKRRLIARPLKVGRLAAGEVQPDANQKSGAARFDENRLPGLRA